MILQPRGELVMAFVVLTNAKGVFGEFPEDALSLGENHEGHDELSPRLQNHEAEMP
jgi:hypothetical protein